jgi:hypothetical protein
LEANQNQEDNTKIGDYSPHGDYTEDMEVGLYQLMSEEDYNHKLLSNTDLYADFDS